jgi:VTC domain-containing protein
MNDLLSNIISMTNFETIQLKQASKVKLMNRMDQKFWFHVSNLPELFQTIKDDYYAQTINNSVWQQYASKYFDTPDDIMYKAHHNGKLNRYKIRRRDYLESDDHFLEIKFKSNKGRTIKKRMESENGDKGFDHFEGGFIQERSIFNEQELIESLKNTFYRLTLINKDFNERCTLDVDINFFANGQSTALNNLAILEIKSEKGNHSSPLKLYLRDHRLKSSGFSKYCIGRALTNENLKRNRFKQKIRTIEKTIKCDNLYKKQGVL